jgi:hypothetical protein
MKAIGGSTFENKTIMDFFKSDNWRPSTKDVKQLRTDKEIEIKSVYDFKSRESVINHM